MDTAASSRFQITFGTAGAFRDTGQPGCLHRRLDRGGQGLGDGPHRRHCPRAADRGRPARPGTRHQRQLGGLRRSADPDIHRAGQHRPPEHQLPGRCPRPGLRPDPAMNRATRRSAKAEIGLDVEETEMPKITDDRPRAHRPGCSCRQRAACPPAGDSADQSQSPVQDQHRFGCRRRDSPGAHLGRHRVLAVARQSQYVPLTRDLGPYSRRAERLR